jgi:hypothetical protein
MLGLGEFGRRRARGGWAGPWPLGLREGEHTLRSLGLSASWAAECGGKRSRLGGEEEWAFGPKERGRVF